MTVAGSKRVYIVDDDSAIRRSTFLLLTTWGYMPSSFASGRDFLDAQPDLEPGCVLLDVRMPDIDGLRLLELQRMPGARHPIIVMTGHGDVAIAVRAMKLGAVDFIEKPFEESVLLETIEQALSKMEKALPAESDRAAAKAIVNSLSPREVDVLRCLLGGASNKVIAFDLGLSARTVEMHRANMMERLGVRSLSDALTMGLAAGLQPLKGRPSDPAAH